MAIGKKGVFFTLIAILVVGVLLMMFSTRIEIPVTADIPQVESRVKFANSYVKNIEDIYLERMLFASSFRALHALALYTDATGSFFSDMDEFHETFSYVAMNGTLPDGNDIDDILGVEIMENNTFEYRIKELTDITKDELKFEINITPGTIRIHQGNDTGPWRAGVNLTVDYFVDAGIAVWNKKGVGINSSFEILSLDDPLYMVNTDYTNEIEKTPHINWSWVETYDHVYNQTYRYEPRAPNYLMRFATGVSSSNCCGIESLINRVAMPDVGFKEASFVDYCYWNDNACTTTTCGSEFHYGAILNKVDDIYPDFRGFRLDSHHLVRYNLTSKGYGVCTQDQGDCLTWTGGGCGE